MKTNNNNIPKDWFEKQSKISLEERYKNFPKGEKPKIKPVRSITN